MTDFIQKHTFRTLLFKNFHRVAQTFTFTRQEWVHGFAFRCNFSFLEFNMLDCFQCCNHDTSQEILMFNHPSSSLSVPYNTISAIVVCVLYAHKSTRAVSAGASAQVSHTWFIPWASHSYTEFQPTHSFTISTSLPSLFIKLGLASCVKHSDGLCISFQNSFQNMKRQNPRHF